MYGIDVNGAMRALGVFNMRPDTVSEWNYVYDEISCLASAMDPALINLVLAPYPLVAYAARADRRIYFLPTSVISVYPKPGPIHPTDTPDRLSMAVDDSGYRYICYGDGTNIRLAWLPPGPITTVDPTWNFETVTPGSVPIIVADPPYPMIVYRAPDGTLHLTESPSGPTGPWDDYKLGDATSAGWQGADYVNGNVNVAFANAVTGCLNTYTETGDHVWTLHETTYSLTQAVTDPVVMVARHDLGGHLLVMGNSYTQGTLFFYSIVGDKFFWPYITMGTDPRNVQTVGIQDFAVDPVTGDLFGANHNAARPAYNDTYGLSPVLSFN
jgi:hypothetical protein